MFIMKTGNCNTSPTGSTRSVFTSVNNTTSTSSSSLQLQQQSPSSPTTTTAASKHHLLTQLFGVDAGEGGGSGTSNNNKTKQQQHSQRPHLVRIGSEWEILKKNRKLIDKYLRKLGALISKDITLNIKTGFAYFSFKKFIVVIEVPNDNNSNNFSSKNNNNNATVMFYTMVCRVNTDDNQAAVLKRAMELNYMQLQTRGSTLGIDKEEVNLCYTTPICSSLSYTNFQSSIESFLLTAIEVNEQLDAAKKFIGRY